MKAKQKEVFVSYVSYTEDDEDDFRIIGDDYKEVLQNLCVFLNDQLDFPYRFSLKPMINGEEIKTLQEEVQDGTNK